MTNQPSNSLEGPVKAKVTAIFGGDNSYAVTRTESVHDSVTFSLSPGSNAWQEDDNPIVGVYVVLDKIRKHEGGWRAYSARFYRLSDEEGIQQ